MFEQEYTRANDRIHPRKDLLKEMEAKWAVEASRPVEEEKGRILAFPGWVRYAGMAAGILLCVGLGMGSMLLLSRSRGAADSTAQEAPMMAKSVVEVQEDRIITEPTSEAVETEDMAAGAPLLETKSAALAYEPPKGMRPAADEAEVENAVRYGLLDRAEAEEEEPQAAVETDAEVAEEPMEDAGREPARTSAPTQAPQPSSEPVEAAYPKGELFSREDIQVVFQPTTEQVHVVRYANKKLDSLLTIPLGSQDAHMKRLLWMGDELLAIREKGDETELLRFDVADWKTPKHRRNLIQGGTFLGAGEMNGKLAILSLCRVTEEEPLPWVDGARIDFDRVLLNEDRPGDVFTVLTVYDPAQGDVFASQTALLAQSSGAVYGQNGLLLWTEAEDVALYSFVLGTDGLSLMAETTMPGTILAAAATGEGFELLVRTGETVTLLILDETLQQIASCSQETGAVRYAQAYEDGVMYLTDDALHVLTTAGDRSLLLTGDGFRRLTTNRLLVMSLTGKLELIALDRDALESLGAIEVRDSLSLLIEDPSRMDYDPATGRLVFPAGQRVHQFLIQDGERIDTHSAALGFTDHNAAQQRELRCLLAEDKALIFYKDGVVLCNQNLARQNTYRY